MDMFSVQPPEWLQKRATIDYESNLEAGKDLGSMVGSGLVAGIKSVEIEADKYRIGNALKKGDEEKADKIQGSLNKIDPLNTGGNFFSLFNQARGLANDPMYVPKMEAAVAKADLYHAQTADQIKGMKEFPEWMKETGGDPDKMRSTPWTGSSQYGSQLYDNQMKNLWMKDYHDQIVETKQQDALNKLQSEKDRVKSEADKLAETKSNNAIRAGIAQDRADTYKDKNQYFKSGSDIYKVNPDTQELEKVVTGKDSKVSADDSLELLNKRTMLQSKLESLTRGGGFGIHWNKTLKPDDQKTVAIYQKQIDDINQKLGMGSDESGTQGGSETPVTSRFKILEVK